MRLASLALCLFLLTLCSCSAPPTRATTVRIAIGGQTQLVYLPATLAAQLHFYEAEGLAVSLTDFQGGSKALEALLGGSADVVCGYYDHIVQMRAKGRQLTPFIAIQRYPGLVLAVSEKIRTLADLKGKNVGVSAPGSSTDFFLKHALRQAGVAPEDVSVVGIGMSSGAVAAMEYGKVDAAVMADPAISILLKRKPGMKILIDTRTEEGVEKLFGVKEYPAAVLYSTEDWVRQNPGIVDSLSRAMLSTLKFIETSPREVAGKMPVAFQGDDPGLYAETVQRSLPMFSRNGQLPPNIDAVVERVLALPPSAQ